MKPLTLLRHTTTYRYDRPVALGPHIVRLRPAPEADGRILGYTFRVSPTPHALWWQQDPHGNRVARLLFAERTSELRIDVELLADLSPINPFDFLVDPSAEWWPLSYPSELVPELGATLAPEAMGPLLSDAVGGWRRAFSGRTLDVLVELNRDIYRRLTYLARPDGITQSPEETLTLGTGSCRDSAWLLVQALRQLGCAARFVSGYLIPPGGEATRARPGDESPGDVAGLHAWVSVYVPGAGWIGFDPTAGTMCGEGHIPLVSATHFANAAPIEGTTEPATVEFSFRLRTRPLVVRRRTGA